MPSLRDLIEVLSLISGLSGWGKVLHDKQKQKAAIATFSRREDRQDHVAGAQVEIKTIDATLQLNQTLIMQVKELWSAREQYQEELVALQIKIGAQELAYENLKRADEELKTAHEGCKALNTTLTAKVADLELRIRSLPVVPAPDQV